MPKKKQSPKSRATSDTVEVYLTIRGQAHIKVTMKEAERTALFNRLDNEGGYLDDLEEIPGVRYDDVMNQLDFEIEDAH